MDLPQHYGLALHTTSGQLGLAISNFQGNHRQQCFQLDRDLSTHLQQYLQDFVLPQKWSEIAFIAVAKGPGGFTGIRLGMVTARTLAQQLNVPLYGISTLAGCGLKRVKKQDIFTPLIAVQMSARRGQLFGGIYAIKGNDRMVAEVQADQAYTPETWSTYLDTLKQPYTLLETPSEIGNTVTSILDLGYAEYQKGKRPQWYEILPFYGQNPVE